MDWHEGFQIYGEHGSVLGKTYNPWFLKSSDVECFSARDGQYHRPLGEDAHVYRRQVEGFADTILNGAPMRGRDRRRRGGRRPRAGRDRPLRGERRLGSPGRRRGTGLMEPGIFAKTFRRPTLEATLDAVAGHGLRYVQFNLESAGLPALPDEIPTAEIARTRRETAARGIEIAALSGTYNMAHPDPRVRASGLARLGVLAAACQGLGTRVITLCTGSRDPDDMWRGHPANDSPAAWRDLLVSLAAAIAHAEAHDLVLGIEPEPGNVVSSAARGRDLLREMRSPRLGIVLDPANLVAADPDRDPGEALAGAVDLLGEEVILVHAKDRDPGGEVVAAGRGIVPWDRFVALVAGTGYDGPLILHGLAEEDVPDAVAFLRERIADHSPPESGNPPVGAW